MGSGMPTMPNIVGLELPAAHSALQSAGVLVPSSLGYFGIWPISVSWIQQGDPSPFFAIAGIAIAGLVTCGTGVGNPGIVVGQSPLSGNAIAANAAMMLSVAEYPVSVAYP